MSRPKTSILVAASLFPLAKPVQEMVMPEAGKTPMRKSPTAQSPYLASAPVKKSLPRMKTTSGISTKLISWVTICKRRSEPVKTERTLRVAIIG